MSNAPDSYDHPALTSLSEDERMFKEAIKSFALAEIEPLVREMESKQNINLVTALESSRLSLKFLKSLVEHNPASLILYYLLKKSLNLIPR